MKVSLIVFGALAISFIFRHRSAALRHWVIAAGIVCAAAVPLIELVVPGWRLPIGAPAAFEPYAGGEAQAASTYPPVPAARAAGSATVRPNATGSQWQLDAATLVMPVWIAGTAVGLGVLLVGLLRLWWLAAHARRVTAGRWSDLAAELSDGYGLKRPVALLQSDHPSLLVTWGIARPKVVLPISAQAWPEDRIRVVLTHELAHISRSDWLVQVSAELLRAIYWFNPLLWIACRRLRLESEHACDDEVMRRGVGGSDYASHLVELARALHQRRHTWFPAPAMARSSSLERRVRAMLNDRNRAPVTKRTRTFVFASLFVITTLIAAAQSGLVSLTGAVTDEHDRGIAGATVILTNDARQAKYEVKTTEAGRFEFVGLPPGSYGFEVRGIGFKSFEDTVTVAAQNLQRNVKLQIGSLQETINVVFDDSRPAAVPKPVEASPRKTECVVSADGGKIVPPKKIRDLAPQYPDHLRGTGTEGVVRMEAVIGADGIVGEVRPVGDPHPDLALAAIAAVQEWRYTETLLNCQPVEVMMTVTVTFKKK